MDGVRRLEQREKWERSRVLCDVRFLCNPGQLSNDLKRGRFDWTYRRNLAVRGQRYLFQWGGGSVAVQAADSGSLQDLAEKGRGRQVGNPGGAESHCGLLLPAMRTVRGGTRKEESQVWGLRDRVGGE